MEEGTFTHNSSVKEVLDTTISSRVVVKDVKKVLEDVMSGAFNNRVMRVETNDIPIHTTSKSSPQAIRFGVEIKGSHPDDEDVGDYIKPYISNESGERFIIYSGRIVWNRYNSHSYPMILGSHSLEVHDYHPIEPHSRQTYKIFGHRFEIVELGEEDASYRDLVFHFKIKGNNLLLNPVNSRSVIVKSQLPFILVASTKTHKDPSAMVPWTLKSKSSADCANAIFTFYQDKCESTADITLICQEKMFPAHKTILAARSDVFAAMFNHSTTEEGRSNEVKIKDTDSDTLARLLW